MPRPALFLALLAWLALAAGPSEASGILGEPAPPLTVDSWHQLPEGREALELEDLKGRVVYLYFFQSWCPGCHSHGFPTLKEVRAELEGAEDVVFVAVQTVFEGVSANTVERGLADLRRFGLEDVPFGHASSGGHALPPAIMHSYQTGGTPWTVVIGKDGVVRFNGFRIDARRALELIRSLR